MKYVVHVSTGLASFWAWKTALELYGPNNVIPVFADVKGDPARDIHAAPPGTNWDGEDEDNYRFLADTERLMGQQVHRVEHQDGLGVWGVIFRERAISIRGPRQFAPCTKILKMEALDAFVNALGFPTTAIVGLGPNEMHRVEAFQQRVPNSVFPLLDQPHVDNCHIMQWLEDHGVEAPRSYHLNYPHGNCFAGETRFLTSEGVKTLAEKVGKKVVVMTRYGKWTDAEVKSFGRQPLRKITLRRYGREKVIFATPEHRWFRYSLARREEKQFECVTDELRPGYKLVSTYGGRVGNTKLSPWGVAHGIAFGDGCAATYGNDKQKHWKQTCRLRLCGEKNRVLARWFPLSTTTIGPSGDIIIGGLPRFFKEFPSLSESRSYLYGWLAGYFAADGNIGVTGDAEISSSTKEHLEFARNASYLCGMPTLGIRTEMRIGFGQERTALYNLPFFSATLPDEFFLIDAHRARNKPKRVFKAGDWTVVSVEGTDRLEEVFCAVVDDGHCFVLDDNILTGNCGGACIKAGHQQWVHCLLDNPGRFLYNEFQEDWFRRDINPNVAILRDRSGGKTRPLPLRELRERVESGWTGYDRTPWGGCACFAPVRGQQLQMLELMEAR